MKKKAGTTGETPEQTGPPAASDREALIQLVERALNQGAQIEVVREEARGLLAEHGHIGALLRYQQAGRRLGGISDIDVNGHRKKTEETILRLPVLVVGP